MSAKFVYTLILLLWLAVGASAESTTTEPAAGGELRWRRVVVPISFSTSLRKPNPALRADADVEGAVKRSLETWESAANIQFTVNWTDKTTLSAAGPTGDGVSLVTIAPVAENLLFFGGDASEAAGRTRVFYNRRGEITEADIVLNPYQQFSTDGSFGTFDLESTLTHEIGHLLGLSHSEAAGATMSELQARNGLFNSAALGFRTLSGDDIARIRSLYGAREDADCCGSIDGRLTAIAGRAQKMLQIWAEFADSGRLAAQASTASDGAFSIKGLVPGRYRLFAQDAAGSGVEVGVFDVARGRSTNVVRRVPAPARSFDVQFAGLGGQLTRIALPVSGGRTYFVYLAGRGLDASQFTVQSSSPFVAAGAITNRSDFGKDLDVIAIEVNIAADIPAGEFSLAVRDADGRTLYLPGRLTVERGLVASAGGAFE